MHREPLDGYDDLVAAGAGIERGVFEARMPDAVRCRFDGLTQVVWGAYPLTFRVLNGSYECETAGGLTVEAALFSLEARVLGKASAARRP